MTGLNSIKRNKMTPKEKAEELVDKFVQYTPADSKFEYPYAKQCALIAVNQVVDEIIAFDSKMSEANLFDKDLKYWLDVLKEIMKS
jgi:hypothetical protein